MLTPEFLRLLALAQLVTPEVVRLGQEGDIEGATAQASTRMLTHFGIAPLTPEEVSDVAEIVRSMLAASYWANCARPSPRGVTMFDALNSGLIAPTSRTALADSAA